MSNYVNRLNFKNRFFRLIWNITYVLFFKYTPNRAFYKWRNCILRFFGAKIGKYCLVAPSVRLWAPWNLIMHDYSLISSNVRVYNPDIVEIFSQSVVSENVFLCTASHDITSSKHPLITAPIFIKDQVWVATDAFIMMGVTIGEGAVVGARACVFKDVEPWTVVGGNPAKFIKKREIKH